MGGLPPRRGKKPLPRWLRGRLAVLSFFLYHYTTAMRILGVILIVAGIMGFLLTGVSYTTSENVIDMGPLQVEREKERSLPITPVASGVLIIVGGTLTVVGMRRETG